MGEQIQVSLVSIIVPVYNQEAYVGKCLKSICQQSYHNLQIIVVDDGSKDRSRDIIEEWERRDSRIFLVSKENEGVAFARRDGLKYAKGDYVVFVDSDDTLPSSAIKDLIEPAERYGVDVVIGNSNRLYVAGIKRCSQILSAIPNVTLPLLIEGKELFEKYYISFFGIDILPVNMWGRIYRRSVIDMAMREECLFDKNCLHMGEDEYFNLILFPHLKSIYVTDKIVYTYRFGGITSVYNRYLKELFYFGDIRLKLLDKYRYTQGYGPLYVEYKNILYSELLQRIRYLKQDKDTLVEYIEKELNNRYLVQRMIAYYAKNDCPVNMKPIVEKDSEKLYNQTKGLEEADKMRFLIKKILLHILAFLKAF